MSSVYSRTIRSIPHRTSQDTWLVIVDLLTKGRSGPDRSELLSVGGIVSSLIADQAPVESPIVITCDGPRTRMYCVYDEDAIDDSQSDEENLGFDPLNGEWAISLPCKKEDLDWVQTALKRHTTRITARDESNGFATESVQADAKPLTLDTEAFLKS